jgi:predicted nucleic acid-binding protein
VAGGPLYAPALVSVEVTNILRRLERARQITTAAANAAYEDLLQLDIELFPFQPFSQRIWELRHTVTSYDASYVALAESISLPLQCPANICAISALSRKTNLG